MNFKEYEIRDAMAFGSIKNGYDYYNKKMVQELIIFKEDESSIIYESKVRGKSWDFYKQSVELKRYGNKLSIDGVCSCPVRYNCKHVMASCLELVHNKVALDPMHEVNKWLGDILRKQQNKRSVSEIINNEYFLTYRIFATTHEYYREDILFYKSKYLKNGAISKGSLISSDNVLYGYNYGDITNNEDEEILELCKGVFHKFGSGAKKLENELGFIILKKLVETNRCFFANEDIPLVWSDLCLDIEFFWDESNVNYIQLKSNIKAHQKIINTKPPLLIDTNLQKVFQLKSDLNPDSINFLLSCPKIPREKTAEVLNILTINLTDTKIPTPKEFEHIEIKSSPIPVLTLYRMKQDKYKFHTMTLDFVYESFLLCHHPINDFVSFIDKDKKIDIFRDIDFEIEAKKRLESLGFTLEIKDGTLCYLSIATDSMHDAFQRWSDFLDYRVKELENDNWDVRFDESFDIEFEKLSHISVNTSNDKENNWFEFGFNVSFQGKNYSLVDVVSPIISEFDNFENLPNMLNIEMEDNSFLQIDKKEIEPILKTIFSLYNKKSEDNILKVAPFEVHMLENFEDMVDWKGKKEILELSKKLKNYKGLQDVIPPKSLQTTLRDYQQFGFNWLNFLYEFKFNGILADDMGLGKTIQTLTHLSKLKEDNKLNKPSLIIMPTSLIANWKNEANKFTPNLKVLSIHGQDRASRFEEIEENDLILSTYPLMVRDYEILQEKEFLYIILDEAQKIKNHKTKMSQIILTFKSEHRLALSGTPIENHLGEMWSIFNFLMPSFLGTNSFFRQYYQNPIEKDNLISRQEEFNRRIKPFVLRRIKEEVAKELPQKSEIIKYTQFDTKQAKLYETIRVTMEKKVRDTIEKKGLSKSHITILDALLKLRQVCCDPKLLSIKEAKIKESAKMELLLDLLDELLQENRKILLFSQFTSMLKIIEEALIERKIRFISLTGSTRNREAVIEAFKTTDINIFLISLKAGGVGLNLVEADTVIHYDPWWNPAVENQATDRAYRIGQDKPVFVYKLIVENSIEQKIIELQKKKLALQNGIYDNKTDDKDIFKGSELLELLN